MAFSTHKLFMPPTIFRNNYDGTFAEIPTHNMKWHELAAQLYDEAGNGAGPWVGMYDRQREKDEGQLVPTSDSAIVSSWDDPGASVLPDCVLATARAFEACLRHNDTKSTTFCCGDGESGVASFVVASVGTAVDRSQIAAHIVEAFGFDPYYAQNETNLKKHEFGPVFRFSKQQFDEASDEYAEEGCPPAPDVEVAEEILGLSCGEAAWEQLVKATQILNAFGETYSMRLGNNGEQALGPMIWCAQNEQGVLIGALCESQW